MTENILALSLIATPIAKGLTDLVRLAFPTRPAFVSPLLALLFGVIITLLLLIAGDSPATPALLAQGVLAGIQAGLNAVGITALQRSAT